MVYRESRVRAPNKHNSCTQFNKFKLIVYVKESRCEKVPVQRFDTHTHVYLKLQGCAPDLIRYKLFMN